MDFLISQPAGKAALLSSICPEGSFVQKGAVREVIWLHSQAHFAIGSFVRRTYKHVPCQSHSDVARLTIHDPRSCFLADCLNRASCWKRGNVDKEMS